MSKVMIRIPTPLRRYTQGADEVSLRGATAGEVLTCLGEAHDGILDQLLDEGGELRSFVNLYIGERNIRSLAGLKSPVSEGDVLSIVPAVAGGAR